MTKRMLFLAFAVLLGACQTKTSQDPGPLQPVPFNQVKITDNFWAPRLDVHADITLQTCIAQSRDSTERINNFKKAAGLMEGGHEGKYYDDSDVYKAMEGIAYSLINHPNPDHEALLDEWIGYIAAAQEPDGYLNTYFTLEGLENRWTMMEKHEMYCGGHMIEAAIAHFRATGKSTFLDVATKFADHLLTQFGPGKRHWVAGHQEIELALVKLYHVTGKEEYLHFAHWVLEERGHGHGVGWIWEDEDWGPAYVQDDIPVAQITDIKGHAVRAMYLFTGMADVAAEMEFPEYEAALERVWEDVVMRNMYVTGGIGSSGSNEGFTEDYDLPNKTAYCETCASIGMVLWNNRMNLYSPETRFPDVMERSLYNGVLPGISLSGDLFFYVNPLASEGDHHRRRWYGTACCPSNLARFIPSVGNYIYMENGKSLYVNLFVGSETTTQIRRTKVQVTQKTGYPWEGEVTFTINPDRKVDFPLYIRIPGWCEKYTVSVNGETFVNGERKVSEIYTGTTASGDSLLANGYLLIERKWEAGDEVQLKMEMPVKMVASDPNVMENIGKYAVQRGPIVYCIEQQDNPGIDFDTLILQEGYAFDFSEGEGILEGMTLLKYSDAGKELTFIPYFAWDNRDPGKMKVWIDYAK